MILVIEDIELVQNGIELFKKILCGEMKLEKVKRQENIFRSNINEISRGI